MKIAGQGDSAVCVRPEGALNARRDTGRVIRLRAVALQQARDFLDPAGLRRPQSLPLVQQ